MAHGKESDTMNRLKDKSGVISVLFVIAIFITAIIAMAFVSIGNKLIAINEVQGIMDIAGVMALRSAIDETEWRLENLVVDKSEARNAFINTTNSSVGEYVGSDKLLKDFKLQSVRVYEHDETKVKSLQGKNAYYLEATGVATYSTYSFVDRATMHVVSFFDFLTMDDYSSVAVGGRNEDGDVEVVVRTVSRLNLR